MSRIPLGRRHGAALAFASATLLCATSSSPAHAASYEQISRATGSQGAAPFDHLVWQRAASDTGLFALFSVGPIIPTNAPPLYVRDVVFNTTRKLSDRIARVFGVDRTETRVLALRRIDDTADQQLVLFSTLGGPARTIATFPAQSTVEAALSGDGTTVAINEFSYAGDEPTSTTKLVNLRTGASTPVPTGERSLRLHLRSLSDDGKVLAGTSDIDHGFYFAHGEVVDTAGPAAVSPNGAVVAETHRLDDEAHTAELALTRVTDGQTRTVALPQGSERTDLAWISPDGSRVAITSDNQDQVPAKVYSATTGGWATFGGPYALSLQAPIQNYGFAPSSVISRSGRYALVDFAQGSGTSQSALVDLTGRNLPGTQEPVSAASYVFFGPPLIPCGQTARTIAVFHKADAPWIRVPKSARIEAFVDGTRVTDETHDHVDGANDEAALTVVTIPPGAKKVTYRVTVVDGWNRTLRETETFDVACIGDPDPEPEPEG